MTHQTTIGRSALAMLVGAVVGGNLSMGLMILLFGPPIPAEIPQIWLIFQAYWLGGIVFFALIPFALMHFSNLRHWNGMTSVGVVTMVMLSLYAFQGVDQGGSLYVLAAIGGCVGWIIWRMAYRLPKPEAPIED